MSQYTSGIVSRAIRPTALSKSTVYKLVAPIGAICQEGTTDLKYRQSVIFRGAPYTGDVLGNGNATRSLRPFMWNGSAKRHYSVWRRIFLKKLLFTPLMYYSATASLTIGEIRDTVVTFWYSSTDCTTKNFRPCKGHLPETLRMHS